MEKGGAIVGTMIEQASRQAGCYQVGCASACIDTHGEAGASPSEELISRCVEACLDLGGNTPPGGWPAAFAPALQDLVECYLTAPAVMIVDEEGVSVTPSDEDAGWMDPAKDKPYRWVPVTVEDDAGDSLPGVCFNECVKCSDDPKEAGAGCPVACEREPNSAGCL